MFSTIQINSTNTTMLLFPRRRHRELCSTGTRVHKYLPRRTWRQVNSFLVRYNEIKYVYLSTPPHEQDETRGQFFKVEFNRFKFRVFLLHRLLYQGYRVKSAQLFVHGLKENGWMYTFPNRVAMSIFNDCNHYNTSNEIISNFSWTLVWII